MPIAVAGFALSHRVSKQACMELAVLNGLAGTVLAFLLFAMVAVDLLDAAWPE